MSPRDEWEAACRAYRKAYDAHQNAGIAEFSTTLQAWVDASKRKDAAEIAVNGR